MEMQGVRVREVGCVLNEKVRTRTKGTKDLVETVEELGAF